MTLDELFTRALDDEHVCAEAWQSESCRAYPWSQGDQPRSEPGVDWYAWTETQTVMLITGAAQSVRAALGEALYSANASELLPGLRLVADRIHQSVEESCKWRAAAAREERSSREGK